MKKLILAALLLTSTPSQACIADYTDKGVFKGCRFTAKEGRRIAGEYIAISSTTYNKIPSHGFAVYSVDKEGRYKAQAYTRHFPDECVSIADAWSGRLYKVTGTINAAWNDGTEGPYLVISSSDGSVASSMLAAGPLTAGVYEGAVFYKQKRKINLLPILAPHLCATPEKNQ